LPRDRLWLDIGFGNGSLLMTAKEFGFDVFGIDLRKKNVEDIEQFGIPAYHGTLQSAISNVTFKSKPTVISMADVVEHEPFSARLPALRKGTHKLSRNVAYFHAQRKRTAVAPLECNQIKTRTGTRLSITTTLREQSYIPRYNKLNSNQSITLSVSGTAAAWRSWQRLSDERIGALRHHALPARYCSPAR
jgi:hypothetical protein